MKRLRRRLSWLLVRLAEALDPDWLTTLRRSGSASEAFAQDRDTRPAAGKPDGLYLMCRCGLPTGPCPLHQMRFSTGGNYSDGTGTGMFNR